MIVPGEIISYNEMCMEEGVNLQRGMSFKLTQLYSIILRSQRKNAPYNDEVLENGKILIYECHNISKTQDLDHTRFIPSSVKLEVWKRDRGECVICGERDNLHYDHHIPFSKGGSSLTIQNIRLLCTRHNLKKSDNIE